MVNELTHNEAAIRPAAAPAISTRTVWKGLLWQQWLAHGTLLRCFLSAWVIGVWVLPIFFHPFVTLVFGAIYGCVAGPAFGGSEVMERTEEFTLALPPRRQERYLARLVTGLTPLLGFIILTFVISHFNLPQRVWGLVFQSGFTEKYYGDIPAQAYLLAIVAPLSVYASSFAIAALIPARSLMNLSWLGGQFVTLTVVWVGKQIETAIWSTLNWWVICLCLLASAITSLFAGYYFYARKEGVGRPAASGS